VRENELKTNSKRTQNELVFARKSEQMNLNCDQTWREKGGWHGKRQAPILSSNECLKQLFEERPRAVGTWLIWFLRGTKPECL